VLQKKFRVFVNFKICFLLIEAISSWRKIQWGNGGENAVFRLGFWQSKRANLRWPFVLTNPL